MRTYQFCHLFSGTALALIISAPIYATAATEQTEPALQPTIVAPTAASPDSVDIRVTPEEHPAASAVQPVTIDTQIADKLRAVITAGQFDKRIDRAPEREAMAAFYAARNYAPLWTADGKIDARAKAAIARLGNAAADGLDPADYQVPAFGAATGPEELADADIALSYSALTYARHLATGRIAPSRVVTEVDYGDHTPVPADILSKIADAVDAGAALESFNPPHRGLTRSRRGSPNCAATPSRMVISSPTRLKNRPAKTRTYRKSRLRSVRPSRARRSSAYSPIWSAGAGCRAISAALM